MSICLRSDRFPRLPNPIDLVVVCSTFVVDSATGRCDPLLAHDMEQGCNTTIMLQNLLASWLTCNLLTFLTGLRLLPMCDLVVVMRNIQAYVNCIDAVYARVVWSAFDGSLLQQDMQPVRCVWAYEQGFEVCFDKCWRKRSQVRPWVSPARNPYRRQLADAKLHGELHGRLARRFDPMPVGLVFPGASCV